MTKKWTKSEINYLKNNVGKLSIPTIAKNLERTETSVEMKMKKLGLDHTRIQSGLITMGELARLLKVDRNTVKSWVDNHGLKCIKRITRKHKKYYLLDPVEFWNWADGNRDKIQFSQIEPHSIPPEPDFVEEERRKEIQGGIEKYRVYRFWTVKEEKKLQELKKKGYKNSEIATILNRSSISVQRKLSRIQEDVTT
ncbi:helix-turn-helix protein [Melghiribacillus thermohalophilus]|uniref:Helix-turn-helix protein n=1 Tax=Melghiribacillus thermohalophilus TaxID=1324956 RepID=A0A4R3MUE4_9BACI|nr:helix-turn-helix domain-containing protein [Melghiribacillus thermohalophilus]TCT19964.1 helix-turn-helix protein [Melghiribacillus thermohalophilus]